jgi:tripartite ATP-independent transporter DctM subunit
VLHLIIFLLFIILLLLGVPIAFALLLPSVAACIFYPEIPTQLMSARLANAFLSSDLLAIPLFIFAAQILSDIKICDNIFEFCNKCVGHVRGGLAHVNVLGSVVFAGMSGSALADAASLGKVEIEAMSKQGYPKVYSAALTAASSTIGPIIPPSIPLIVFGAIAQVSIGRLLIGGFLPGIIMAIVLMIQVSLVAKRRGFPKTKFAGFRQLWKSTCQAIPGLLAPIILVGGMLFGFFTPTEAATVMVVYAIFIGFMMKSLTLKELWQSFRQSALESGAMLVTFFGASLISLLVIRLHVVDFVIKFVTQCTESPIVLLIIFNILLLIMGCFLSVGACIMLLTPIFVPLAQAYGIDPVHLGVLMILNLQVGGLTPPYGVIMFVTCRVAELNMRDFLKEAWPFMIGLVAALLIVTYVPQTVLWLPSLFIR